MIRREHSFLSFFSKTFFFFYSSQNCEELDGTLISLFSIPFLSIIYTNSISFHSFSFLYNLLVSFHYKLSNEALMFMSHNDTYVSPRIIFDKTP